MAKTKKQIDLKNPQPATLKNKIFRVFLVLLISILIFGGLIAILGLAYQTIYANKFYPGVKIAGIDVGGISKTEAQKIIDSKVKYLNAQKIKIDNGAQVADSNLADLGAGINSTELITDAYNYGRDNNFLFNLGRNFKALFYDKNFSYKINIDNKKLSDKLGELAPNLVSAPKNATFNVSDNGEVTIQNESPGKSIDLDNFTANILSLVNSNKFTESIKLIDKNIEPTIYSYQLTNLKTDFERIISEEIVFSDNLGKSYVAEAKDIANWLTLDSANGVITIKENEEGMKSYITDLAGKVNKKVIDKKINSVTNGVISEGQDGTTLNEDKLTSQIKDILNNRIINNTTDLTNTISLEINIVERKEQKITPDEIDTAGGTGGLFEGRYLEINLSQQRMYLFDGQNPVGSYSVSTGKWDMPTPVGTRYIQDKNPYAWSEKYGLYMPYWNSIGGGYGIHELPEWPGGYKEGEGHLGTPVSHGCIRLGVGPAETVYNWAPVGTPIYIHK